MAVVTIPGASQQDAAQAAQPSEVRPSESPYGVGDTLVALFSLDTSLELQVGGNSSTPTEQQHRAGVADICYLDDL